MRRPYLAIAALILSGACYHATVETGMAPSGQVVEKEWASSFIGGLVPPAVTETAAKCPNGVAKVETQLSFMNMLVSAVTGGIYSPMSVKATCGNGKRAAMTTVRSEGDLAAAMSKAAEIAVATDAPVLVVTQ